MKVTCPCGNEFERSAHVHGPGKYCNRACYLRFGRKAASNETIAWYRRVRDPVGPWKPLEIGACPCGEVNWLYQPSVGVPVCGRCAMRVSIQAEVA